MNYLDIVSKEKVLELKFGENVLSITYDATKLDKAHSIVAQDEKVLYVDYLADFLSQVIVSWNLDINGEPIPIDKKALIKLNMAFLDYLYKEIQKQQDTFFQASK